METSLPRKALTTHRGPLTSVFQLLAVLTCFPAPKCASAQCRLWLSTVCQPLFAVLVLIRTLPGALNSSYDFVVLLCRECFIVSTLPLISAAAFCLMNSIFSAGLDLRFYYSTPLTSTEDGVPYIVSIFAENLAGNGTKCNVTDFTNELGEFHCCTKQLNSW